MAKKRNKRWRLFANLPIQGGLLFRLGAYWLVFQVAQIGTFAMFDFLSNGQGSGGTGLLTPAIVVSFLCLPLVMLDMLIFSNRFVGPLVNLRNKMHGLANGESVEEAWFRPGDYYQDLGEAFNQIRKSKLDDEADVSTDLSSTPCHASNVSERTQCNV